MSYFTGIKVGDRVWSLEDGWGTVENIIPGNTYGIIVKFDVLSYLKEYDFNGKAHCKQNQTLFWDEIKFEIPERPKIKLNEDKYSISVELNEIIANEYSLGMQKRGLLRNDEETANKALQQITRFAKLLALRDQECSDSRGYEFQGNKNNYFIYKDEEGDYFVKCDCCNQDLCKVYFKTYNDAQKICDILNSGRFDLD